MLERSQVIRAVQRAHSRAPLVVLCAASQAGASAIARTIAGADRQNYFDLDDPADAARLAEPSLAFGAAHGTIVLDGVQRHPDLLTSLHRLADRGAGRARFVLLARGAPAAVRRAAAAVGEHVEVIELPGLGAADVGGDAGLVWLRGGLPRATLAATDADASTWLSSHVRGLATHGLREFGLALPPATIERFLTVVAHQHGNLWNAAAAGRALGISESTARRYVDGLSDAMIVRFLPAWRAEAGKRLVRTPKIYYRDTGLLHALWGVATNDALTRHVGCNSSWESHVIDETLRRTPRARPYFWRTSNGAELDLVLEQPSGRRVGFDIQRVDSPAMTASLRAALDDTQLRLDHVWVVYPGAEEYRLDARVTVTPLTNLLQAEPVEDL